MRPRPHSRSLRFFISLLIASTAASLCVAQPALTSATATSATSPAATAAIPLGPNPKIEIAYVAPQSAALKPIYERLKERRLLERLATFFAPMKLPETLKVSTDECGTLTRTYTRRNGATICYEYIAFINAAADRDVAAIADSRERELRNRVIVTGATMQNSVYRVALALLAMYDVPIWGRFADAADLMTAFLMLQFGPETAQVTLMGATLLFEALAQSNIDERVYARTHAPAIQRKFNYLCIAYGYDVHLHNTDRDWIGNAASFFGDLDPGPLLSDHRRPRCAKEYLQTAKAYYTIFWPLIDADKLERLSASAILSAGDF